MSDQADDDYMSDAILQACGDTRPGLHKSKKEDHSRKQRQLQEEARRKNVQKPLKVLEAEKREEGLGTKLDSANKGFALLQKMGYKPGTAMGKSGQDTEKKRKKEESLQRMAETHQKRVKLGQQMQATFRSSQSSLQKSRLLEKFVRQSQNVCLQLDMQQEITEPSETYFWPPHALEKPEEDEKQDGEESKDEPTLPEADIQLSTLTHYLRTKHLYCVWCGYSFDDANSLTNDCPGNTAEDHDEL